MIFPGALGDFICFLPALQTLSRAGRVDLYAHSEFADLVPIGVTVRSLESAEISTLFVATTLDDSRLHDQFGAYAAVYSWMGSQQPVFVNKLQAVTHGRAKIFPFRPAATAEHQTDYYLRCLRFTEAMPSPDYSHYQVTPHRLSAKLRWRATLPERRQCGCAMKLRAGRAADEISCAKVKQRSQREPDDETIGSGAFAPPGLRPDRPLTRIIQTGAPAIELRDEALRWCENFWTEHSLQGRALLTIAPGSGAREKNWPEEFFVAVANWWRERTGGIAVLLIGPVEAARGGIDRLREHCLTVSDLSLPQVAALISRSAVYLGNDSGISHLAAAVGAATVALFGPSDPRQWAPRGRRVTVISRLIHCSPCSTPGMKNCPHRACLAELSPEKVIDVMAKLPELASLTRGEAGITV